LNPALLRSCNFNGCYWISAITLKTCLTKCPNLEELQVLETKLTIKDIGAEILPICSKVTSLSFTLNKGDWTSFVAVGNNRQLLRNLNRLISIEMIVADRCNLYETLYFL